VTDGVVASPDVNVLDSVLAQLRSGTVSCSFLHVGSPFHPHCCSGLVPYVNLMQFVADATCGAYLNMIPMIVSFLSIEAAFLYLHCSRTIHLLKFSFETLYSAFYRICCKVVYVMYVHFPVT
jgi:hypothetical protein